MASNLVCRRCSAPLNPADKFCSSCGAKVESSGKSGADSRKKEPAPAAATIACLLCGHINDSRSRFCQSCGAQIGSGETEKSAAKPAVTSKPMSVPLTKLQSWRLTAALAVIFILTVVILRYMRKNNEHEEVSSPPVMQTSGAVFDQINTLQAAVNANPNDDVSLLQLANVLQDAKFYPKAIDTYGRYLSLKPNNVSARVDRGVSYYELAQVDTLKQAEDLQLAENDFKQALQTDPKHQLALYNMGIVSLMQGNMEGGADWFGKAAAIDPTTEVGKKASMLLQQHSFKHPSP